MGNYRRKSTEYLDPIGILRLNDKGHLADRHQESQARLSFADKCCYKTAVRGVEFHNFKPAFSGSNTGWVELVPELGNPHDPFAVAVDFNGKRVGYVSGSQSKSLHWRIYSINAAGSSCHVPCDFSDGSAIMAMPSHETWDKYTSLPQLLREVENLYFSLPVETRTHIEEKSKFHFSDPRHWDAVRERRHIAPSIAVPWVFDPLRSHPLFDLFFKDYRKKRKIEIRVRRQDELEKKRTEIEAARRLARNEVRTRKDEQIHALLEDGISITQIKKILGVSDDRVRRVREERNIEVIRAPGTSPYSPPKRRVESGQKALVMVRKGIPREQIGEALGIGMYRLRELLSLAVFLENPQSNPERLALAVEAYKHRWTESSAPPGKKYKRAVSDAKDISDIESYQNPSL